MARGRQKRTIGHDQGRTERSSRWIEFANRVMRFKENLRTRNIRSPWPDFKYWPRLVSGFLLVWRSPRTICFFVWFRDNYGIERACTFLWSASARLRHFTISSVYGALRHVALPIGSAKRQARLGQSPASRRNRSENLRTKKGSVKFLN